MKISSDYKDLLNTFNAAGVRYLIVGGYAVMIHSEPRYTKDLDIWIDRSAANASAVHTLWRGSAHRSKVFSRPTSPSQKCFTRSALNQYVSIL